MIIGKAFFKSLKDQITSILVPYVRLGIFASPEAKASEVGMVNAIPENRRFAYIILLPPNLSEVINISLKSPPTN